VSHALNVLLNMKFLLTFVLIAFSLFAESQTRRYYMTIENSGSDIVEIDSANRFVYEHWGDGTCFGHFVLRGSIEESTDTVIFSHYITLVKNDVDKECKVQTYYKKCGDKLSYLCTTGITAYWH
jgi:hypothetical protein